MSSTSPVTNQQLPTDQLPAEQLPAEQLPAEHLPAERLARWAERDAAIGLTAELEQARAQLAERDREIANLRERAERLAQRVAQLTNERDGLHRRTIALAQPSFRQRAYPLARRVGGKVLRTLGRRG